MLSAHTKFDVIYTVGIRFPAAPNASTDARSTGLDSNYPVKYARTAVDGPSRCPTDIQQWKHREFTKEIC